VKAGDRLGPYRLEEVLGDGAMGIVFRAVGEPDGETVALKTLRPELADDQVFLRRFLHEARAAREVSHDHLVPILDEGEADGVHFLAMRYVPGRSLDDCIQAEGPLPLDDILTIATQIAGGLDALHHAGLVHRDVKASNILLDEQGDAFLTDFGLAKGEAYTVLTRMGEVMGTLDYLAPELLKGYPAIPASDLYAFGCVVYECVAGSAPFADRPTFQVAMAHVREEPPDPSRNRPDLPRDLGWAVLQAMAKDPDKRPPSGRAYASMLRLAARSQV
jgi:serine/threonine protein kinase